MCEWRKICDELIEAGEKATARPWRSLGDVSGPGSLDQNFILGASQFGSPPEYAGPKICEVTVDPRDGCRDPEYLILAANKADQLARMVLAMARDYPDSQGRLDRIWEKCVDPVAELGNLGEAVKMPEPRGGGSIRG